MLGQKQRGSVPSLERIFDDVKEAVGLYKDDKLLGIIALHKDDAVSVCFRKRCYTTDKNQKEIYYIAQAWYSHLIPSLQIRKLYERDNMERMAEEEAERIRLRLKIEEEVRKREEVLKKLKKLCNKEGKAFILFTQHGCPGCEEVKKELEDYIELNIDNPENREMFEALRLKEVPALFLHYKGKIHRCSFGYNERNEFVIEVEK